MVSTGTRVKADRSTVRSARVLVVGDDRLSMQMLGSVPWRYPVEFASLLGVDQVRPVAAVPDFDGLVRCARGRIAADPKRVDAVVGWWDFPTTGLVPVLRSWLGQPGATPRSVAALEHKYWSRLLQQDVAPDAVPPFAVVDPFGPALDHLGVGFPLWLKPVKSHSSHLGFRVDNPDQLKRLLTLVRRDIGRMGRPFDQFLGHVDVPAMVRGVSGHHCVVEGIISRGRQCTLEGFVSHGRVQVYGTVDSIRSRRHPSCLSVYRYPSTLPRRVRGRMTDIAGRVVRAAGYDNAPFNAEFFWDPDTDAVRILEVNCRISKSHCPLFAMVDGASHQQVLVDLALGHEPHPLHRAGRYRVAAKYMLRSFRDGSVTHMPDEGEQAQFQHRFPDGLFKAHATVGTQLHHLDYQDSYSYELAEVYLGADSVTHLGQAAAQARQLLPIRCTTRPVEAA